MGNIRMERTIQTQRKSRRTNKKRGWQGSDDKLSCLDREEKIGNAEKMGGKGKMSLTNERNAVRKFH